MAGQPTQGDRVVDRAEVEKLLQRVGVDDERIATALDGVEFPDRASRILDPPLAWDGRAFHRANLHLLARRD